MAAVREKHDSIRVTKICFSVKVYKNDLQYPHGEKTRFSDIFDRNRDQI